MDQLETFIKHSPAGVYCNGVITPDYPDALRNGFYIILLHGENGAENHCAGLIVRCNLAYYFDSLGESNSYGRVKPLLTRIKTIFNVRGVQGDRGICSMYVLYFFVRRAEGATFEEFLDEFGEIGNDNDRYVIRKTRRYMV